MQQHESLINVGNNESITFTLLYIVKVMALNYLRKILARVCHSLKSY